MGRGIGVLCIASFLLLAGCSQERNLAIQYMAQHKGNGIMIVPTNQLFKDNLALNYDTSLHYNPGQIDSIAWAQSYFINKVSDSLFLTLFTNSLIDKLSAEGFDVYVDGSSDVFLSLPDPKWIVQVAQLQLNEDHMEFPYNYYSVETGEPETEYTRINKVNLSSWFEVNLANSPDKKVLYLDGYIQDMISQHVDFSFSEGSLGSHFKRDSVSMKDVYLMAGELGKKHAELLYDYFMNAYISANLPAGVVRKKYFYIDPRSKNLKQGQTERFEIMEPNKE